MQRVSKSASWIVAVVGVTCLTMSFLDFHPRREVAAAPAVADARQLSTVFREISHQALPSIVAIETRGKAAAMSGLDLDDEDNPLNDLFRQNPNFREFFRERPKQQRESPRSRGMGSGFIIDEAGVILTNSHVVRGADEVRVRTHDGHDYLVSDIKMDENADIAVLRIKDVKGLKALRFGDSDSAEIGDWVLAVGNPYDVGMTVTAGIISAKSRGVAIARGDFLQTDAAINPGNSGGPLLNLNGDVIGINTAISSRSGGSEGIGFAIPVNMVKWVSQQLMTQGKVRRSYLGIQIQPLTSALAKTFKLPAVDGALITKVTNGSPAADAKLQEDDVILELDGKKVSTTQSLQLVVERLEPGKMYKASIVRDGKKLDVPVTVREMPEGFLASGTRPNPNGRGKGQNPQPKEESFNQLGLQVKELTAEIAKELGYDESPTGVVVTKVDPTGPASEAGIAVGQVIEKVSGKRIASIKEFEEALKSASLKDGVRLLVSSPSGKSSIVVQSDSK
jgi:serine protease Do